MSLDCVRKGVLSPLHVKYSLQWSDTRGLLRLSTPVCHSVGSDAIASANRSQELVENILGQPAEALHFSCQMIAPGTPVGVAFEESIVAPVVLDAERLHWCSHVIVAVPRNALGTLNEAGAHTHQHQEATIDAIVGALRRGDHVVVALNPMRSTDQFMILAPANRQATAHHTALVWEIQPGPDGSTKVILSQPGSDRTEVVEGEDYRFCVAHS